MNRAWYLLPLLLLLAACEPDEPPNYFIGSDGLVMEFIGSSPPDTVYEQDEFNVLLKVSNKGTFSLNSSHEGYLFEEHDSSYLTLVSLNYESQYDQIRSSSDFQELSTLGIIHLEGKSPAYQTGQAEFFDYHYTTQKIIGQRENPSTSLRYRLCYPYQTIYTDEICVDKDIYDIDEAREVCNSQILSLSDQGAPIAVTKVEPTMITRNHDLPNGDIEYRVIPSFRITVQNKGGGTPVFRNGTSNYLSCVYMGTAADKFNKIKINGTIGGRPLICTPEVLRLRDNQASTYCKVEEKDYITSPHTSNFYTTLQLTLDYLYVEFLAEDVSIQRII